MSRLARLSFLLQVLCAGCVILMSLWVKLPWPAIAALGVFSSGLLAAQVSPQSRRASIWNASFVFGCLGVVVAPIATILARDRLFLSDTYYAALAWVMSAFIFLAIYSRPASPAGTRWKILGMVWTFLGVFVWTAVSYGQNRAGAFYFALILWLAFLVACKRLFQMPPFAILTANTLILLLVALPLADWITRPRYLSYTRPDIAKRYYSYEAARKDPTAYARWWKFYLDQWLRTAGNVLMPDPEGRFPYLLRPNSRGKFFDNSVIINSRGFRGREIPEAKGNTYRIVALGESTTFGFLMGADEKAWPELLEEMIRDRLKPDRPVEVINAGLPGFHVIQHLQRLPAQILPLQPDMIITYTGGYGLQFLYPAVPLRGMDIPPAYRPRPLKLLSNAEYRLKMIWYRHFHTAKPLAPVSLTETMRTQSAGAYAGLIETARTNRIRLVLATYSMAVNSRSERDLIEFYRGGFPSVDWWIKANEANSMILEELARRHGEITLVDTRPGLDGAHEKFVDVMHFLAPGEQQMAEHMFAGIKSVLGQDLARAPAGNLK